MMIVMTIKTMMMRIYGAHQLINEFMIIVIIMMTTMLMMMTMMRIYVAHQPPIPALSSAASTRDIGQ